MSSDKIFLFSHDVYNDVALLDWPSLTIHYYSRREMKYKGYIMSGFFSSIEGSSVAFFRQTGSLYLLHCGHLICLDDAQVQMENDGTMVSLYISTTNDNMRLMQEYIVEYNPFFSIDEEDFNFLIFVYNVMHSSRKDDIFDGKIDW